MTPRRTVVLEHVLPGGRHFDWLLEDAALPLGRGRVWAFRSALPPAAWAEAGAWRLIPLPPHRRLYLDYQGPVRGGRGCVRRVDAGEFEPDLWTADRLVTTLRLAGFTGGVELCRLDKSCWRAATIGGG